MSRTIALARWPKTGRLLAVSLVMLDTIRRMLSEAKPIEQWMLGIEALVLLLIFAEFMWKAYEWHQDRHERRARKEDEQLTRERIHKLSTEEKVALAGLILREDQPSSTVIQAALEQRPALAERDERRGGLRVVSERRAVLKKWAHEWQRKRVRNPESK